MLSFLKEFKVFLGNNKRYWLLPIISYCFTELELPFPDINLEVRSGSHAEQTGNVMIRFENVVRDSRPDWAVVYGDVNSTVAAALVCAKLRLPVAHVEAGLRNGPLRGLWRVVGH